MCRRTLAHDNSFGARLAQAGSDAARPQRHINLPARAPRAVIAKGDRLPEFELPDAEGKAFSSRSLAGRACVIYFYPKDFTPGCTTEAAEFSREHEKFETAGATVVGISPDGPASHKKFCAKMSIPYTLLSDENHRVAEAFGVWGKKKFMGREYMGVSRATFLVGPDGVVLEAYASVRPAGHAAQVLERLARA